MVFFISYKNFRIDSTKSFLKKIKFICLRLFSWSNLFISKPSNDLINYHQSKELIYPLYLAIIPQPIYVYIIVGVGVCEEGAYLPKNFFILKRICTGTGLQIRHYQIIIQNYFYLYIKYWVCPFFIHFILEIKEICIFLTFLFIYKINGNKRRLEKLLGGYYIIHYSFMFIYN